MPRLQAGRVELQDLGRRRAEGHRGLATQLELHVDHVLEDRTADDLLYEILLKSGFPLATPVEKLDLAGIHVVQHCRRALLICLDRVLTLEAIRAMAGQAVLLAFQTAQQRLCF